MVRRGKRELDNDNEPLSAEELEEFRELLTGERDRLMADGSKANVIAEDASKLPDEVDLATAEYEAAFAYRLKDREKYLLRKIDKALIRIDEGEYDECESCGSIISKKRLLARPVATLCIVCKEEQEQKEKGFQKKREMREEEFTF
jgi:DnaK suppressor protein